MSLAQQTVLARQGSIRKFVEATAVEVDTSPDVVATVVLGGLYQQAVIEVENVGATTLNAFSCELQAYPGGTWSTYISTWTAGTDTNNKLWSSATLNTLATGIGLAAIKVWGAHAMRFKAGVAASTTTVTIKGICT